MPITTLTDGTFLLTINPNSIFNSQVFVANDNYLPFVSVAAGNSSLPFAATPTFTATAFNTQQSSVSNWAMDSLQI